MRPRFWYCELCGYMVMDTGESEPHDCRSCPACGEDVTPCWDCIRTGVFDNSWCARCESEADCRAVFNVGR